MYLGLRHAVLLAASVAVLLTGLLVVLAVGGRAPLTPVRTADLSGPDAVAAEYQAVGGASGALGAAAGAEVCALRGGGCFAPFAGGSIYWSTATGAHEVLAGAVRDKWGSTGWENGALGYPTADTVCGLADTGCFQAFQSGSVYASGSTAAAVVEGPVRDAWAATGWEGGLLGYPTSDRICGYFDAGCGQTFQRGAITTTGAAAHAVSGAVANEWTAHGAAGGSLGVALSDLTCGLAEGGCFQRFVGGSVYSSPAGAFVVTGAIGDRWAAGDWERGLGYPLGEQQCGLVDNGCSQAFEHGTVFRSSHTDAHALSGDVLARYLALGGPSQLGYPMGETTPTGVGGGTVTEFAWGPTMYSNVADYEGRAIYWSSATGAHLVEGDILKVYEGGGQELMRMGYPTDDQHLYEVSPGSGIVDWIVHFEHGSHSQYVLGGSVN